MEILHGIDVSIPRLRETAIRMLGQTTRYVILLGRSVSERRRILRLKSLCSCYESASLHPELTNSDARPGNFRTAIQ